MHEVIHGALYEAGLVFILHQHEGLEEAIVRAVEHGLRTAELIPEFPDEPIEEDNPLVETVPVPPSKGIWGER